MRRLGIHKNFPVSGTKPTPGLRVGFISSHLTVDKLFSVNPSYHGSTEDEPPASFLFVGDLNGYHREWLGSTTTNRHGVAFFDFATVSGCNQLETGETAL